MRVAQPFSQKTRIYPYMSALLTEVGEAEETLRRAQGGDGAGGGRRAGVATSARDGRRATGAAAAGGHAALSRGSRSGGDQPHRRHAGQYHQEPSAPGAARAA